jgi:hypothetical protein
LKSEGAIRPMSLIIFLGADHRCGSGREKPYAKARKSAAMKGDG